LKRIPTGEENETYRIYAVCSSRGDCQLEDFIENTDGQNVALLRCIADAARLGPRRLPKSRSHLIDRNNGIYEFKGGKLRVGYFIDGGRIVICTHGFLKQSQETPNAEKKIASKAKRDYLSAKEKGDREFIEPEEDNQ
jgi:hypothetical protein